MTLSSPARYGACASAGALMAGFAALGARRYDVAARPSAMAVHVSIHDVSPAWSSEVEAALALCHAMHIRPALLVVPNFHGRAPLVDDPRFCARLRELQADRHEVYLHGFLHQSRSRYDGRAHGRRLAWLFAQRVVSGGEAEMSDVSAEEGRFRIEEGERVLRQAGLRIDGFVAPAWSMPAWLLPLLGKRGFQFTEDHLRVYDPTTGRSRTSVVLNWASRSPARLISTVAWCRAAKHARAVWPARIAIHPGDLGYRLLRHEIAQLLSWARGVDLLD
jgi:predicted deacetylase